MNQVTVDDQTGLYVFTVRQGTTLGPVLFFWQVDGVKQSMSGRGCRLQIRRKITEETVMYAGDTLVPGSGLVMNPTNTEVSLTVGANITAGWTSGGVWDAELYDPLDPKTVSAFGAGELVLIRAVTR